MHDQGMIEILSFYTVLLRPYGALAFFCNAEYAALIVFWNCFILSHWKGSVIYIENERVQIDAFL
jgi:hypothetical protein